MDLPGDISAEELHVALAIFLEHAYRGRPLPARVKELLPPADAGLEQSLRCFEDEARDCDGIVRRWILRAGNTRYPHMKFVLQEHLLEDRFFFSADTHDQFVLEPHFPDLGGWNVLKDCNRKLRGEIEEHWERCGLPTSSTLRRIFEEHYSNLPPAQDPALGRERRVLVADDDDDLCACLATLLRREDFEVRDARDGHRAQEHFERDDLDLAIVDFEMPGLNGIELTRRIRACGDERASLPVLLTSLAVLAPARLTQVTAFLPKPFCRAGLLNSIQRLLVERSPDDPPGRALP